MAEHEQPLIIDSVTDALDLRHQVSQRGLSIVCTDDICESHESVALTNLSPDEQPRSDGFSSIVEQDKTRAARREALLQLIEEIEGSPMPDDAMIPLVVELQEEEFDHSILRGAKEVGGTPSACCSTQSTAGAGAAGIPCGDRGNGR